MSRKGMLAGWNAEKMQRRSRINRQLMNMEGLSYARGKEKTETEVGKWMDG